MKPSTGADVRLHRNAVRDRPESLSAFEWNACPPSPESARRGRIGKLYGNTVGVAIAAPHNIGFPAVRIFRPHRTAGGLSGPAFEGRHTLRHNVEGLLVDGENRSLRLERARIIECSNLDNHRIWTGRRPGADSSTAGGTEVPCDRASQVVAGKAFRLTFGEAEASEREYGNRIWMTARNVLTLTAMALDRCLRFVIRLISNFAAVAAAGDGHDDTFPCCADIRPLAPKSQT